jgi:Hormone-sensitive lipase (HSL) N-terminus
MEIDESIVINPATLLVQAIDNNIEHFDKNSKFNDLKSKLSDLRRNVENCSKRIVEIESFASDYDFDESSPGNGHRSFVDIFHSAVEKTSQICKQLITNRSKILFRSGYYAKYIVQLH